MTRLPERACSFVLACMMALSLAFAGCSAQSSSQDSDSDFTSLRAQVSQRSSSSSGENGGQAAQDDAKSSQVASASASASSASVASQGQFRLSEAPEYSGEPSVAVHGDMPYFEDADFAREPFEQYSKLDKLGRCGVAFALITDETMPTAARESIAEVRPAGFRISKYDFIDGKYLYNRCHLIAYQLAGENANARNLTCGTRYLNVNGMEPLESDVADYVRRTGGGVLYRVTPVFEGDELVPRGVLMEAASAADGGVALHFCRYCYNVQPGVEIDYATGENHADGTVEVDSSDDAVSGDVKDTSKNNQDGAASADASTKASSAEAIAAGAGAVAAAAQVSEPQEEAGAQSAEVTYILNTRSHRFHYPDCKSVDDMSEKNKQEFTGTREEAIDKGYRPCGNCKP